MSRRALLNCWIVAMWLWLAAWGGKGRRYIWTRWSYSFRGLIPHFGVGEGVRWKSLAVIEFVPKKRDLGTWRNFLILFRGQYRVWRLHVVEVRRFDTREEALAYAFFKGGQHASQNH